VSRLPLIAVTHLDLALYALTTYEGQLHEHVLPSVLASVRDALTMTIQDARLALGEDALAISKRRRARRRK